MNDAACEVIGANIETMQIVTIYNGKKIRDSFWIVEKTTQLKT